MKKSPPSPDSTPDIWKALADPSRRRILDLLRQGPRTTGDLATVFAMSRYGVMKHLGVLHTAGLILIRRQGRERWNHLNPVPLRALYHRWLRPFEEGPAEGLLRLRDLTEAQNRSKEPTMSTTTSTFQSLDIQLEIAIAASPETVWKALTTEMAAWWPKDFLIGPAQGLIVEPHVGGRIYEDWGDGDGACWGTVIVLETGKKIQWAGDLTAEYGGPARTFTTYTLVPQGEGTLLQFRDTPFGRLGDGAGTGMEDGWKQLLEGALKSYCEGR
jgi:DNA-binding transcriptional ArsR family regulator/uncharacterized protein YndB with AHSA1/START domain